MPSSSRRAVFVLVAVEADGGLPDTLDQAEHRLAFLGTDGVAKDAAEQADVVAQRQVLLGDLGLVHLSRVHHDPLPIGIVARRLPRSEPGQQGRVKDCPLHRRQVAIAMPVSRTVGRLPRWREAASHAAQLVTGAAAWGRSDGPGLQWYARGLRIMGGATPRRQPRGAHGSLRRLNRPLARTARGGGLTRSDHGAAGARGEPMRRDRPAAREQPGSCFGPGSNRGFLQLGFVAGHAFRLTEDRWRSRVPGDSRVHLGQFMPFCGHRR